ncbi:MAG: glycosyltransferase [Coriobacteriia bacterium]|nr:glycosyltransferase [Coriobacteriia bacterium]
MSCEPGLRVLIIGPARSVALEQWVEEMEARGHTIAVLSPDVPRPALERVTETTEAGPRIPLLRFLARILRVRAAVRAFAPDVVHGHGASDYGLWAVLSGHSRVLVTCWGSDVLVGPRRSPRSRWKVRYALTHARYVTATSETLLEAARALAGRHLDGEALSWGVDTGIFYPATEPREAAPLVFLSLRALEPLYNIDAIIRAFARIDRNGDTVQLIVAGRGSQDVVLETLAEELGASDSIRFVGWVDQSRLPDLYRNADVYLSVPSSDASAVSNMEAMASGLGIIVADLPSTREWIRDEEEGLLVKPGNVNDIHDAMLRLMHDEAMRRRLGEGARVRIEMIGQRSHLMDRASELYKQLSAPSGDGEVVK